MRSVAGPVLRMLAACTGSSEASSGGGIQDPEQLSATGSISSSSHGGGGGGGGGDPTAGGAPFDPDGPDPLCPTGEGQGGDAGPDSCGAYRETFCRVKDDLGCRENGGTWLPCTDEAECFAESSAFLDCLASATNTDRCGCTDDGAGGGGGGLIPVGMDCAELEACSAEAEALDACLAGG